MADDNRGDAGNAGLAFVVGGILLAAVALSFFGGFPGDTRGPSLSFDPSSVRMPETTR